jgi:alpha/beta superfamily hydrolase
MVTILAAVTNAAEALRQHMKQEATNELVSVKRHHFGFVVGAIILPAETDATVLASEQPTVGDRDTMRIAPQIMQHLLGPTEGTFGINDPIDVAQRLKMARECRRLQET